MIAGKTLARVEAYVLNSREHGNRVHLGASIIGKDCSRSLWYTFNWATNKIPEPRLLRLWARGHREEDTFIALLRNSGIEVWDVDSDGNQFRISDHCGHFGGSLDGVVRGIEETPEPCLLEMKTYNEKRFKKLISEGVREADWTYYVQQQIYMRKRQLNWSLFAAVNKNDDSLHFEMVPLETMIADRYIDRAGKIIWAAEPPPRIKEDSTYYLCKFCDARKICHKGAVPEVNCRTCEFSSPGTDGGWHCRRYSCALPVDLQRTGCTDYVLSRAFAPR